MPRNGSGSYNLPNGPFVPSTVISSTTMNQNLSDLGTALTQSIANDGQTTPVANLPMATFRHTNVGNAVSRTDYAAAGQVQDSSLQWLTSVSGADTITASITPSPSAYVAGQTFRFTAAGANTVTAPTLNINGLGAKTITKRGAAPLVAGDIASGQVVQVVYDGTQFQLAAAFAPGSLIAMRVFTTTQVYTPTAGTSTIIVEGVGGGGAGGGVPSAPGNAVTGGGGGAAAYGRKRITSAFSGVTITIGAGGTGVAAAAGGAGTTTSFGALLTLPGGNGGLAGTAFGSASFNSTGGAISSSPTGGDISNQGKAGSPGFLLSGTSVISGTGADTTFGPGGAAVAGNGTQVSGGTAAAGFGAGGSGAIGINNGATAAGGNGSPGVIVVYEFA